MDKLTLQYRYDDSHEDKSLPRDDFGRLSVQIETERFRGKGGFWVRWQDVVAFGESLRTYPIAKDAPVETLWGYDTLEGDDVIIRIRIEPKDALGRLLASVEIADDHDRSQRLKTSFRTTYAALDVFRQDIAVLMDQKLESAVLHGH